MKIPEFQLERFLSRWEFTASHLLCSSDVEGMALSELLALADDETRALYQDLKLGYTEAPGHPLLRAEIAKLYQTAAPSDVYTFGGAQEAIFTIFNVLLGAGDHAIVTWPGYQSLYEVARATGAEVTLIPLSAETAWALSVDAVAAAMRPTTRLVVINSPHNPTGALLSRDEFEALVALCERRGVRLFSDEVYRFLEQDPHDRLPAVVDCSPTGVSLGVMSKAFALAGLRIGWLATRDHALLRGVAAFKDYTTICNAAPSEILALIALRQKEAVLSRSRRILADNLERLDGFFQRWAGTLSWTRPRAGSVAFPQLTAELPVESFAQELVEKRGVLILPETVFGHHGNHFRIGFGRTNLPEALQRFDQFLVEKTQRR